MIIPLFTLMLAAPYPQPSAGTLTTSEHALYGMWATDGMSLMLARDGRFRVSCTAHAYTTGIESLLTQTGELLGRWRIRGRQLALAPDRSSSPADVLLPIDRISIDNDIHTQIWMGQHRLSRQHG